MLPLENIRVLSFGTGGVGPDSCKILGELGADVIKIESKDNLDFMRTIGPDINNIAGFNEANRNKRSFGVDLKSDKGKELVKQLITKADILIENYRGGVMKSLGLEYHNVKNVNPEIIYVSSQGFGGGGPFSDHQAYGPMLSSASGMLSIWAQPDDPYPVGSNSPLPDHMASKHVVIAALAALDYRRRSGKGQFVDMAQTEVAANLVGEHYLDYTVNKRVPQPMGNRVAYAAPHGCYACQGNDEWCAIAVFTDEEWLGFCNAVGNPPWTKEPKFADLLGRLQNIDELDQMINEWTTTLDACEVMDTLQAAGVAAGVVQRAPDTLADPQLQWLGATVELDHAVAGRRLYPGIPFKMSGASPVPSRSAPLLGEHTDEICRDLLGISDDELNQLLEKDILHNPSNTEGTGKSMFG
ncbi:MAG: CoA transferase [Dehalococcoidia bacterium]|nr:MAG: CoA transferase [Dehalococcoidia bacterium]